MDWTTTIQTTIAVLVAGGVISLLAHFLRNRSGASKRRDGVDFRPSIGFALQDGFKSVALLLDNKSRVPVYTEEIEIVLTELTAHQQTAEATCHETHKIRQTVSAGDMLPISLVEVIYLAAGKPQRKYSCILFSLVRYRAGEKWFEENMPAYRLKMIGLTVAGIHRERKSTHVFQPKAITQENPQKQQQEMRPVETNTK